MTEDIKEFIENKIKEIRIILNGIDTDEGEDGWWETSYGAEFGKKKLQEIDRA